MAPRRIKEQAVHLHWAFKHRTAQLRLARVTFEPTIWNGVCRLSHEVCYVRFFADGQVGYAFERNVVEGSFAAPRWRFDLPSFLRPKAIAEIERRFQAHLATRALIGAATPTRWVRDGFPCERCPPCVATRKRRLG